MCFLVTLGLIELFLISLDILLSIDRYITERRYNKMVDNSEKVQKLLDKLIEDVKEENGPSVNM